jgi:hypothetical protein
VPHNRALVLSLAHQLFRRHAPSALSRTS